jgi:DNA-binding transcriptional LysR family regulator
MAKVKLDQLEMLVMAADSGSFSAAAVELECTQSRISHGIAELERRLGTQLLVRSTVGCLPTAAGLRVLSNARQMLKLADAIGDCTEGEAALSGQIKVACLRSVVPHLLPHALHALSEFKGLHVEILDSCNDHAEVTTMVQHGAAELGITRMPVDDRFVACPLVRDNYVIVAPASPKLKSPVCWEELAHLSFIEIREPGATEVLEQCRSVGFQHRPARSLTSARSILALVGLGLGFTLLPRLEAFPNATKTQVLELPIPAVRQLSVFATASHSESRLVKKVMQFITDRRLIMRTDAWHAGAIALPG